PDIAERFAVSGRQRRARGRHILHEHQIPPLALTIRDAPARQRFERSAKAASTLPRVLGHTTFLSPIARQKDDDAIGFTERVGPKNQCIARVKGHRGGEKTVLQGAGLAKARHYDRREQVRLKPDTTSAVRLKADTTTDVAKARRQSPAAHVHL